MKFINARELRLAVQRSMPPTADEVGMLTVDDADRHFLSLIDKASTADVVEIKRGEWIFKEYHPFGYEYICSVCGFAVPQKYKHCPECISRMDGGDKNE